MLNPIQKMKPNLLIQINQTRKHLLQTQNKNQVKNQKKTKVEVDDSSDDETESPDSD